MIPTSLPRYVTALLACALAALGLAPAAAATVDVPFAGRIAFSSVRTDPQGREFDIFSMNADGSGLRRLTTNPETDRQSDWSPGGRHLAYSIDKPGSPVNFELARMTALGTGHRQLTTTPEGQSSTQPSWLRGGRAILFRRSGRGRVSSIWQMGPSGERPMVRFAPLHSPLYPSFAPNGRRVLYAAIVSPSGDTDRGIFTQNVDGSGMTALFDVPGAIDSAPAWSPDGERIAFESNADVGGGNPERDMEVWVMDADGGSPMQLTRNAAHDEGPAWSPDGRLLAYTSGPDDRHGDIHVMTAGGRHLRALTADPGADESPDWQAIPAPRSDARCGDADRAALDVRRAGSGLRCRDALALARRWVRAGRPRRVGGYAARTTDFGGIRRVLLRRGAGERRALVAFVEQHGARR